MRIADKAALWSHDHCKSKIKAATDQELEACVEWLQHNYPDGTQVAALWAARRPKPPSLKEQALAELNLTTDSDGAELSRTQVELIRRALEALPE